MKRIALIAMTALCVCAPPLFAQTPRPPAPAAPKPEDPAMARARQAWEALPESERRAIQDDLVWSGSYRGVVQGEFGRLTFAALKAITARRPGAIEGVLIPAERAALAADAARAKETAGFTTVFEPRSGVSLGLPRKFFPKRENIEDGARFESLDGAASVETFHEKATEVTLQRAFEALKSPPPGRRVSYSLLRPDFFVVALETPDRAVYIRVARGGEGDPPGLRGFRFSWPKAQQARYETISVALSNAFDPFPKTKPPAAAEQKNIPAAQGPAPAQSRLMSTALALAADRFVALPGPACAEPRIGPRAARLVSQDAATGLALFEAAGAKAGPFAFAPEAATEGASALAFFATETNRGAGLTAASGDMIAPEGKPARLRAAIPINAAGALVLTRSGRWLGLAAPATEAVKVAGAPPPPSRALVSAEAVRAFAKAQGLAPALSSPPADPAPGSLAAAVTGSLEPLSCAP